MQHELNISGIKIPLTTDNVAEIEKQIAAFNEEKRLPETMEEVRQLLKHRTCELSSNKVRFGLDFPSDKRPRQIIAITKIMQVADALNGEDCVFADKTYNKNIFYFDYKEQSVNVMSIDQWNFTSPCFKTVELAHHARKVLGDGDIDKGDKVIKEACGVFED